MAGRDEVPVASGEPTGQHCCGAVVVQSRGSTGTDGRALLKVLDDESLKS